MTRPKSTSRTASWYRNSGQSLVWRLAMWGCEPVRSARVGNWSAMSAGEFQECDRLSRQPLAAAREAEPVGRRRPDSDAVDVDSHRSGQPTAHRDPHLGDPRALADQDAVRVHELEAAHPDDLVAPLEQPDRRGVEPLRVRRREELADVPLAGRAEDRVDQRVCDHIAVRMPGKPGLTREVDAGQHERDPVLEAVRVDSEPDPQIAHAGTREARSSLRDVASWASGQSFCKSAHGPRTTKCAAIPALVAGTTSLSRRSPTYRISPGGQPTSDTILSKNSWLGFSTPQRSDEATKSTSVSRASNDSSSTLKLPAIPTTSPSSFMERKQGIASS